MPANTGDGHSPGGSSPPAIPAECNGINDLIAAAEALRHLRGDAATRAQHLVAALKQHRRQAKAVEAAVSSLRNIKLGI